MNITDTSSPGKIIELNGWMKKDGIYYKLALKDFTGFYLIGIIKKGKFVYDKKKIAYFTPIEAVEAIKKKTKVYKTKPKQ